MHIARGGIRWRLGSDFIGLTSPSTIEDPRRPHTVLVPRPVRLEPV